ncbi:MAG: HTH domain-containing protein [bacterium]
MAVYHRVARLLELLTLIRARSDLGPKDLARHFKISEKRIYDDLTELNKAGISIVYNPQGGIEISQVLFQEISLQ